MSVLAWIAAVWLVAAVGVSVIFFAARRSRVVHAWMFGESPTAEIRKLAIPADTTVERPQRLAA